MNNNTIKYIFQEFIKESSIHLALFEVNAANGGNQYLVAPPLAAITATKCFL